MTLNSKTNLVDNVVLEGIVKSVKDNTVTNQWRGTMTELDSTLVKTFDKNRAKINNLPGSPSALRVVLNRIANRLRTRGISVKFGRTNDPTRTRFVKFVC